MQYGIETGDLQAAARDVYKSQSSSSQVFSSSYPISSVIQYTSDTKATLARILPNLNPTSRHLTQKFHSSNQNMSQQSSSVGQNPAPKQKVPNQGELKICILVSFLWSNTSNGPIATRDELLASIREYIGQRQGTLPELESMLKFYTNLPRALGRIHQVQDEDLLGLFISRVTPNIDVFKRVTSITMVSRVDIP